MTSSLIYGAPFFGEYPRKIQDPHLIQSSVINTVHAVRHPLAKAAAVLCLSARSAYSRCVILAHFTIIVGRRLETRPATLGSNTHTHSRTHRFTSHNPALTIVSVTSSWTDDCLRKPEFHYADFPDTFPSWEISRNLGKRTSRVCRGLVADVTGKSA